MRRALPLTLLVALLGVSMPSETRAHPLAPAVLSFMPNDDGTLTMTWRAPVTRPKGQALTPRVPDGCTPVAPTERQLVESDTAVIDTTVLRCDPVTLEGITIGVDGLTDSTVNVVVRIGRADGIIDHTIIDTRAPSFVVEAPEARKSSFVSYLELGIEHLVTGWDHLTFVIGLLVLF